MTQFKKAKIVMLPVEKEGILRIDDKELVLGTTKLCQNTISFQYQHLYLLSDEEIKEGDLKYCFFTDSITKYDISAEIPGTGKCEECKKIISSTDKSLGLPEPSSKFVEKYCILGGIDEVMVEYYNDDFGMKYLEYEKVVIYCPDKIEGCEVLHLENKLKVAPDNTITIRGLKNMWNRGEMLSMLEASYTLGIQGVSKAEFKKFVDDNLDCV